MEYHHIFFLSMIGCFMVYMVIWMGIRKWMGLVHHAGWEVLMNLVFFAIGVAVLGPLFFGSAHAQSINVDSSRSVIVIPQTSMTCMSSSFSGYGYGYTLYDENCIIRMNTALSNASDPIGELIKQLELEDRVCSSIGINGTALTSCRQRQIHLGGSR